MAKKIKALKREDKKKKQMPVSGKSVFHLAKLIGNKSRKRSAWPRTNFALRQRRKIKGTYFSFSSYFKNNTYWF